MNEKWIEGKMYVYVGYPTARIVYDSTTYKDTIVFWELGDTITLLVKPEIKHVPIQFRKPSRLLMGKILRGDGTMLWIYLHPYCWNQL